jgi:hypothetical protein
VVGISGEKFNFVIKLRLNVHIYLVKDMGGARDNRGKNKKVKKLSHLLFILSPERYYRSPSATINFKPILSG